MKQSLAAAEAAVKRREVDVAGEEAKLEETRANASKWIAAAEQAQGTEREIGERVREVKEELRAVEARAQEVERDAQQRAQAVLDVGQDDGAIVADVEQGEEGASRVRILLC